MKLYNTKVYITKQEPTKQLDNHKKLTHARSQTINLHKKWGDMLI